ncbi:MAG: cupin domain-containing protein [Candidatus Nanopelagicales bacterium]
MADEQRMTHVDDLAALIEVNEAATVSRTVMRAEGARLVLFSFDTGEELSEHTAAMPVLLWVLGGRLTVTAGGETVALGPGGIVHLPTRMPHAIVAQEPTRMMLVMLDAREHG